MPHRNFEKCFLAKMISAAGKSGIKEEAHQDFFAKEIAKLSAKAAAKHQFRIPRQAAASLSGLGLGPAWGSPARRRRRSLQHPPKGRLGPQGQAGPPPRLGPSRRPSPRARTQVV